MENGKWTGNVIFQNRMKGVGILKPEDAISYGCSGPTARGSGVACDVRKNTCDMKYIPSYSLMRFWKRLCIFCRYLVRVREME